MDPARREALTWNDFKEEVYDKYIPMSYRRAKIVDFHTLKQGNITVTEYDRALCEMTRYAPELVDTDEKMAVKFRSGLRHEIRVAVANRRGISYSEILSCTLDVEEALPKDERVANPTPPTHQPNYRDKGKWEGNRAPYDNKRHHTTFCQPQNYGRQIVLQQRGNQQRAPHCNRCSKYHFGECRAGGVRCFTCGGNGHMSRECPNNKGGVRNGQGQRQQQQPQPIRLVAPQQARAYALKGTQGQEQQANKGKDNLAGMGKVQQLPIIVLFDTGASHSFISMSCVNALELPTAKLDLGLRVSSPVGGLIDIVQTCPNVEFVLGELGVEARLLHFMPLENVDIILGMDWLAENHASCNTPTFSTLLLC
ncbi:uncharacterized protein LOC121796671 [Salvia splendens]|uniref:uncharacterized protein LOC121796671 n=1 Tax=Salvia splendens TaxID=180675 RepID=UPI001C25E7F7|nr:uncharacterized protein LOC121796671 [Salvia splendens]